jgi:transposase InsO family protein
MAFTAFVTDVFSRCIVGWRTASRMPTELPLDAGGDVMDALEMVCAARLIAGLRSKEVFRRTARSGKLATQLLRLAYVVELLGSP